MIYKIIVILAAQAFRKKSATRRAIRAYKKIRRK